MQALSVEIHDVCPPFASEVDTLLDLLAGLGVSHPTLLVVPHYRDRVGRTWPLRAAPTLCQRLARLAAGGSEIVLHGLCHRAPRTPPSGIRSWLLHHAVSRGEAEFAHLGYPEALARLRAGLAELALCGLAPRGFIAPVWQLSPGAVEALEEVGLCYTAGFRSVRGLGAPNGRGRLEGHSASGAAHSTDATLASPVLTYCAPAPGVDHAKRLVMRAIARRSARAPLVRVALHPEDARVPGRLRHIRSQIQRLLRRRRLWRYSEGLTALRREAA